MRFIQRINDPEKCWWCGSADLTREHKAKKTDLKLLFKDEFTTGRTMALFNEQFQRPIYIQGPGSDSVKFSKSICESCNGSKSKPFDFAYQKLVKYYYEHKDKLKSNGSVDLTEVFGANWICEIRNVYRYIGKHLACRMAEVEFKPSKKFIDFLNGEEKCHDLKIVFQIKPFRFGDIDDPIEFIYLGPFTPINESKTKGQDIVTAFSGWYTVAGLSFNYIYSEEAFDTLKFNSRILKVEVVDWAKLNIDKFSMSNETIREDILDILDSLEYYPFSGSHRELDHFKYVKGY